MKVSMVEGEEWGKGGGRWHTQVFVNSIKWAPRVGTPGRTIFVN